MLISIQSIEPMQMDSLEELSITAMQKNYVTVNLTENEALINPNMDTYTIQIDDTVIGFACFVLDETGDLNLIKFMIDHQFQGKGYGKEGLIKLLQMKSVSSDVQDLWLSVHCENMSAISLYKKVGFVQQQTEYDAENEIFFKYSFV